jgi:hypothetical protein
MNKLLLLALSTTLGCATTSARVRPVAAECPIADWSLAAAERDFDEARTQTLLARLEAATRTEQARYDADPSDPQIGLAVAALARESHDTSMVSADAGRLAVRLRQLDCAVRAGRFGAQPRLPAALYQDILAEVEHQEGALRAMQSSIKNQK